MAHTPARASSSHPLANAPGREQRVRERAYHLWEADSKPHGRDVEYWERARELIDIEERAASGPLLNPRTSSGAQGETPIEEAELRGDVGSFHGHPAPQIDSQTRSPPKRRARAKPKKSG